MSLTAEALRKLASLSLSSDQMAGVLDILADLQAVEEQRKAGQRDRVRKHRQKRDCNVTETLPERYEPVTGDVTHPPKKETSPAPLKEKTTPHVASLLSSESAIVDFDFPPNAFDRWYGRYPNKVGKDAARKAFDAVRKSKRATFADLMAGLETYIASKPTDRAWCNPATWLNQGRWADEPSNNQPGDRPNGKTNSAPGRFAGFDGRNSENARPSAANSRTDPLDAALDRRMQSAMDGERGIEFDQAPFARPAGRPDGARGNDRAITIDGSYRTSDHRRN